MKARSRGGVNKVEQQMTPMIDIVFQLLTFFVMSFKIATQEGDFNVKMPTGAPDLSGCGPPPIRVRLLAGTDGDLAGIQLGERPVDSFQQLQQEIIGIVGPHSGPNSFAAEIEVEFDCDYNLHYSNVVQAITASSGYVDPQGGVVRLIEKIKFAPPRQPSGAGF